jgi:hypothetical protein
MFKSLTNLTATGFAPCFAHKSDGRAHTKADSQCASPDPDHSQPRALASSAFSTVLTVPITRAPGWRAQWLKRYRCPLECLATDRGKAIERSISYLANGRGMRDRSVLLARSSGEGTMSKCQTFADGLPHDKTASFPKLDVTAIHSLLHFLDGLLIVGAFDIFGAPQK